MRKFLWTGKDFPRAMQEKLQPSEMSSWKKTFFSRPQLAAHLDKDDDDSLFLPLFSLSNFQFALEICSLYWLFNVDGASASITPHSETWKSEKVKISKIDGKSDEREGKVHCNFATFSIFVLTWKSIFEWETWRLRLPEQDGTKKLVEKQQLRMLVCVVPCSIVDEFGVRVLNWQTLNLDQTHLWRANSTAMTASGHTETLEAFRSTRSRIPFPKL